MARKYGLVIVTIIIALMLDIIPLPGWVMWLRPNWALLVVICWALYFPELLSVGIAFVAGLMLDFLNGTLLGEHALGFVLVTFVVVKVHKRLKQFPMPQKLLAVVLLLLMYKLLIYLIQLSQHQAPTNILFWLSVLVSAALWPWIKAIIVARS